jgi:hypothetical protein
MRQFLWFVPLCLLFVACDSGSPANGGAEADVVDTTDVSDTGGGSGDTSVDTGTDTAPDGGDAGMQCRHFHPSWDL